MFPSFRICVFAGIAATLLLSVPRPAGGSESGTADSASDSSFAVDGITSSTDVSRPGAPIESGGPFDPAHLREAAGHGDAVAELQLGYAYEVGIGVKPSNQNALHWYQLSAASGCARAKVNMGVMYLRGNGVRKDEQFAAQLFRQASDGGDGAGASYLGDMYLFGRGMTQSLENAERWYKKGLKLHDPTAAYDLGMLATGTYGHPVDLKMAARMLKKSADAGFVPAMHSLGLLYVRNPELAESPEITLDLLQTSSNSGAWRSSVVLAILNRDGKLTSRNPTRAYYYFRLATLQGGDPVHRFVSKDLTMLETQLGRNETASLNDEATAWQSAHPRRVSFVPGKKYAMLVYSPSAIADDPQAGSDLPPLPPA